MGFVAGIEAVLVVGYTVAIGVASLNTSGTRQSTAPIVLLSIYLIFALGIGAVARGFLTGSGFARTPFMLIQIFVLVSAYTFFSGDGIPVKITGVMLGMLGAAGLAIAVTSIVRESEPSPES